MKNNVKQTVLLASVLLLLGVALAWNFVRTDPSKVSAPTLKASDYIAPWRCLSCGTEREAPAGNGPQKCEKCGKDEVYVVIPHSCMSHGILQVAMKYDEKGEPSSVKVENGEWAPYVDTVKHTTGLICPQCRSVLRPAINLKMVGAEEPDLTGMPSETPPPSAP